MNPYSPLKIFKHQDRLNQLKEGRQIIPTRVQLVVSDLCNQSCSFCSYRWDGYSSNQLFTRDAELASFGHNNPNRMIPYEKVVEILDDCAEMGVRVIECTGGGEFTVHPRSAQIFQDIVDRKLGFALVTNGVLIHKLFDKLLHADWVRISIDAGNAESYGKQRHVSSEYFHRVWDNVEELCRLKMETRSGVYVGVGFVVHKDNWKEVIECAEKARKVGADNIRISAAFQPEEERYFEEFYGEASRLCKQAEGLGTQKFRVFNRFGDRVDDLKEHNPDYGFCGYQQFSTYIGGDLIVYRCCVYAYNERGIIGSIKNRRFKDLWLSREKEQNFNGFDARGCERCMFNDKNRMILYALENNSMHVNYV